MSIAKRRKRKQKRRNSKLRKLLRKNQKRINCELRHSDLLNQFQAFIDDEYTRGEITLYRWAHEPITGDDFQPQLFQSFSDIDISDVYIPSPTGSKAKVRKYVDYFTLSHFMTEKQAVDEYKRQKEKLAQSDHPERLVGFIENKGQYVQKVNYGEDDVMFARYCSMNGHINVLPCIGLDPSRVIDDDYIPVKIELD